MKRNLLSRSLLRGTFEIDEFGMALLWLLRLLLERLQYRLCYGIGAIDTGPAGPDDALELLDALLQPIVHQDVIVLAVVADLVDGHAQPPLHHRLVVLAAAAQALDQHLVRR